LELEVTREHSNKTVLYILTQVLGLSRGIIKHLKFLDDGIMLNGNKVTVRAVVNEGDRLYLNTECEVESQIEPVALDIGIAYEDDDIVVPDKPPFMPTHPSHDHYDDTVANALAYRYRDSVESFVFRPVNRLVRNTSGLLIIAQKG
jgi:23S rRNA pseudouridine1911/1915/1917 synthase